jgi:hypothetical protein
VFTGVGNDQLACLYVAGHRKQRSRYRVRVDTARPPPSLFVVLVLVAVFFRQKRERPAVIRLGLHTRIDLAVAEVCEADMGRLYMAPPAADDAWERADIGKVVLRVPPLLSRRPSVGKGCWGPDDAESHQPALIQA